ncbi:hypothetical protein ['Camptotheca acuminata' phytoplasma]|uniref:hypothetical protein n=1 Tax='Camptotheca acuminata' phytoplasma TaxID=3239192 RepID=UPI00351A5DB1
MAQIQYNGKSGEGISFHSIEGRTDVVSITSSSSFRFKSINFNAPCWRSYSSQLFDNRYYFQGYFSTSPFPEKININLPSENSIKSTYNLVRYRNFKRKIIKKIQEVYSYHANELKSFGFSAYDLSFAGFTDAHLKSIGFSDVELRNAHADFEF